MNKVCLNCKQEFTPHKFSPTRQKFCSTRCRNWLHVTTWRRDRQSVGLCPNCGKKPDLEFVYCQSCRFKRGVYYADRAFGGKCRACKNALKTNRRTKCPECLKKDRETHKSSYYTYKEAGVCVYCPAHPIHRCCPYPLIREV